MNSTYYFAQATKHAAKRAIISAPSGDNPKEYYATQDRIIAVSRAAHALLTNIDIQAEIRRTPEDKQLERIADIVKSSPVRATYGGLNVIPELPGLYADTSYVLFDEGGGEGPIIDDERVAAEIARLLGRKLEDWRELSIGGMASVVDATVGGVIGVVTPDSVETHDEHEED